jgi:hypothetical protein
MNNPFEKPGMGSVSKMKKMKKLCANEYRITPLKKNLMSNPIFSSSSSVMAVLIAT